MPRLTHDPEELRRAIVKLRDEIRDLKTRNVPLQGRRFLAAGDAVSSGDFITKRELDAVISAMNTQLVSLEKKANRIRLSVGDGPATDDPSGALPPPNHPMDFGYYKVEGNKPGDPSFGAFLEEVRSYTNHVVFMTEDFGNSFTSESDREEALKNSCRRAHNLGFKITLDLQRGTFLQYQRAVRAASEFWSAVKYIVFDHEPSVSASDANGEISVVRSVISDFGLSRPPIGVYLGQEALDATDVIHASLLDFVATSAYSPDPDNHGTSAQNIATVQGIVAASLGKIPQQKRVHIVMQAYDRNGVFAPIVPDLVAMQRATYLMVYQNTRVDALLMFSYGRAGGSRENQELIPEHRAIWGALQGGVVPGGPGDPPPTNPGATRCGQGRPCCGGLQNEEDCPRWCDGGDYRAQVQAAVQAFVASAPAGVMDPSNPTRIILDVPAFMSGVVARLNLDFPNLIAQVDPGHDGKEIVVKLRVNAVFSEQWSLWAGAQEIRGFEGNPPPSYRATCYPPRF